MPIKSLFPQKGFMGIFVTLIFVVIFVSFGFFIYLFIARSYEVFGSGMSPTLSEGDKLFTEQVSLKFSGIARKDIVVIKDPQNEKSVLIKRVIGLPGEEVRINTGKVYINDEVLPEEYLLPGAETPPGKFLVEKYPQKVPLDSYFVLNDNRLETKTDSRDLGFFKKDMILSKFWTKYYSVK